eukprot:g6701.t1
MHPGFFGREVMGASSSSAPRNTVKTAVDWSSGLYDCLDDAGICVWGVCCLPCLFGENTYGLYATDTESGPFILTCCLYLACLPFYSCIGGLFRNDLRRKYGLKHEPCGDCVVHLCCFPCAICQEAREIKHHDDGYKYND